MEKSGRSYAPEVENGIENGLEASLAHDADIIEVPVEQAVSPRLRLLWEHRSFVWRWLWVGTLASLILAFIIPRKYESTVRLMPPDTTSAGTLAMLASLTRSEGLGMAAASLLGMKSSGALFIGVLQSREVQDRLINRFDLRNVYGEKLYLNTRKRLSASTDISEDRKSGIITIVVTDKSPARARDIANAYAEELGRRITEANNSSAHRERISLEKRLEEVQKEWKAAANEYSAFASKTAALNIPEQGKAIMTAAARVEGELVAAQSELQGLQQIYTPNNVRVRSLRARIGELQRQLDVANRASADDPNSLAHTISELPRLGVTWAELYRRTMIAEAVFEALSKQYELAKIQEAKETPQVSVLDPGELPEKKSSPKRSLVVLAGIFFSLVLSASWIIARDHWERADPTDERKLFLREVWDTSATRARISWRRLRSFRLRRQTPPEF